MERKNENLRPLGRVIFGVEAALCLLLHTGVAPAENDAIYEEASRAIQYAISLEDTDKTKAAATFQKVVSLLNSNEVTYASGAKVGYLSECLDEPDNFRPMLRGESLIGRCNVESVGKEVSYRGLNLLGAAYMHLLKPTQAYLSLTTALLGARKARDASEEKQAEANLLVLKEQYPHLSIHPEGTSVLGVVIIDYEFAFSTSVNVIPLTLGEHKLLFMAEGYTPHHVNFTAPRAPQTLDVSYSLEPGVMGSVCSSDDNCTSGHCDNSDREELGKCNGFEHLTPFSANVAPWIVATGIVSVVAGSTMLIYAATKSGGAHPLVTPGWILFGSGFAVTIGGGILMAAGQYETDQPEEKSDGLTTPAPLARRRGVAAIPLLGESVQIRW